MLPEIADFKKTVQEKLAFLSYIDITDQIYHLSSG